MKILEYLTLALSVFEVLPGRSAALNLPARRVDGSALADSIAGNPLLTRRVEMRHCRSTTEDAAFFERSHENWVASNAAFVFLGALVPAAIPALAGVAPVVEQTLAASSAALARSQKMSEFAVAFASVWPLNVGGNAIDQATGTCDFANKNRELEQKTKEHIQADVTRFYNLYATFVQSGSSNIITGAGAPGKGQAIPRYPE
ncbi:MAG: hypothetical protein Q9219_007203 [cf. Caloplaca sp. 3 TL-2023]